MLTKPVFSAVLLGLLLQLLVLLPNLNLVDAAPSYTPPPPPPPVNQTFTLTAIASNVSGSDPSIVDHPLLVAPPSGIASLVLGSGFTAPTVPFEGFVYNGRIYRTCPTSPTGACLGFLTKAYGGALTGWYFDFSDTETPYNLGPGDGPIIDGFEVRADPDAAGAGSPTVCKPTQQVLFWSDSRFWTFCSMGTNGTYSVGFLPSFSFSFSHPISCPPPPHLFQSWPSQANCRSVSR